MSTSHVIPVNRTVHIEAKIHVIECANCAIDFGIGEDFMRRRREDHQRFYCPNGHANVYNGLTEAEQRAKQLERELELARAQRDRHMVRANGEEARRRLAERQRAAAKGQVTKIKNRVANGVCPCCSRSFANLAAHMAGQHPDYVSKDQA